MTSFQPTSPQKEGSSIIFTAKQRLPLIVAASLFLVGGFFLLNRADTQARDTIRKHHLEDLEKSLYFARNIHGTYPPYDEPTWCGFLNDSNSKARIQIEKVLRAQHEKYANPDKPFPHDPLSSQEFPIAPAIAPAIDGTTEDQPALRQEQDFAGYFYWKRNPATFELYSILETNPTRDRSTAGCPNLPENQPETTFDYGITSIWRENI